jgi:hypothetical protein
MFLEVTNLSEIVSVDGKLIKKTAWKGIKDMKRCNQFQWPCRPPALTVRHWQIRRKTITDCFLNPMKVADRELVMPLGDWDKDITPTWQ